MTREERLKEYDRETGYCLDHPFDIVHIARAKFISLMNDFESRTCENCKHDTEILSCIGVGGVLVV